MSRHILGAILLLMSRSAFADDPINLVCKMITYKTTNLLETATFLSNSVDKANFIYGQVGMSFRIDSLAVTNSGEMASVCCTNGVGKLILTKAIGTLNEENLKGEYK